MISIHYLQMKESLQKERVAREQIEVNQEETIVQLQAMEEALNETEAVKVTLESQLKM